MAVPCRHCGRTYDVTLFEFGRTIWCTCGHRVGLEARVRAVEAAEQRRFIADSMLGGLARWLRLLGFDCLYEGTISDERLVQDGVSQGRHILTRDRALPEEWRVTDIYVVRAEKVRDQLAEVVHHFELGPSVRVLSRCSECNALLERVARSAVSGRVPQTILPLYDSFCVCPECGRVYWEGSHARRIRLLADRLITGGDLP